MYSVGGLSGGIMTEALLGVYPDVFTAGVSLMGVPCGCWAEGYNDVTGNGSSAQWSGSCADGNVTKTAQAWGDLVRSYYPNYKGHRPRLQHWHGTSDTTLNFKNQSAGAASSSGGSPLGMGGSTGARGSGNADSTGCGCAIVGHGQRGAMSLCGARAGAGWARTEARA